ncbi:hypothetical protein BDZ97DRAFT_941227 [Flammula alnicola]|nr:hypothetical protein BDZ97DRAFT_941227 [Flammula alnicola]
MAAHHLEEDLESHIKYLRLAVAEAEKCTPTPTAFCVGCLLVVRLPDGTPPTILAQDIQENSLETHMLRPMHYRKPESCPPTPISLFPHITSVTLDNILSSTDVYTTLEPCSIRTSGLAPCADALIASKVKRCFIGVGEPDDFVKCEGAQKLKDAGIEVIWLNGLEAECLAVARRGHEAKKT